MFTIGLIGITAGLRTLSQRTVASPSPTAQIASLPLTPLPQIATPTPLTSPSPSPTASPTATATPTPTPTVTPTPTPSPTPEPTATPTPAPYSGPLRNNGGDYVALAARGITIDGNLDDWQGYPSLTLPVVQTGGANYAGNDDLAVKAWLAWDTQYLYLAAEVSDDKHVQELRSYDLFNGDEIELWLDADLAGDFNDDSNNGDDFQVGFSPGDFDTRPPEAVVWYPTRRADWNSQIQITAQPVGQGYRLEAAIPWVIFDVQARAGQVFGYALNASDNDTPGSAAQETILMQTPGMAWGRPTTFSNLYLQ